MSIFCYKNINTSKNLGCDFKDAREKENFSLEHVANITRLPLKYLEAIEENRFFELPLSKSHRHAYIKELCRFYKMDFKQIIYKFRCEGGFKNLAASHPQTLHPSKLQPSPLIFRNLALVCFVLFFIGYLGFQMHGILTPPKLVLFSPSEGAVSDKAEVALQGETDKESQLLANGQEIKVNEQGKFNDTILLSNGVNTITLSTIKKHGKTTTIVRHVVVMAKAARVSLK